MSDRWLHPDPFDPDCPPPHWEDEDGNFAGWISEAELAEQDRIYAEAIETEGVPDYATDIADLGKPRPDDPDAIEF
jgi:hypothetical protein